MKHSWHCRGGREQGSTYWGEGEEGGREEREGGREGERGEGGREGGREGERGRKEGSREGRSEWGDVCSIKSETTQLFAPDVPCFYSNTRACVLQTVV